MHRHKITPFLACQLASRLRLIVFCAVGLTVSLHATARESTSTCVSGSQPQLSQLDRWATAGDFRVLYAAQGEHAPKRMQDKDLNGTPDYVDDILTQLLAAQHVFENVWGLLSPLKQPRYAGSAGYIDVPVLAMQGKTGTAYSGVRAYRLAIDGEEKRCNLRIDVSNELVPHTLTPVHELFHLYQYGYTQIKVRWYLEGMARWSESAIAKRQSPLKRLPSSPEALETMMKSSYTASDFWRRLGELLDSDSHMLLSADFQHRNYTDGRPIFQDHVFQGGRLIKSTLLKLQAVERAAATRLGWSQNAWREEQKFSPLLNHEVMRGSIDAFCELANKETRSSAEVQELLRAAAKLQIAITSCH